MTQSTSEETTEAAEAMGRATRGLVNMGFAKTEVKRAVEAIVGRRRDGVSAADLVREAIGALM